MAGVPGLKTLVRKPIYSTAFIEPKHLELLFTKSVAVLWWGHFSQYELVVCPMALYAMYSVYYDMVQMYYNGLVENSLLEKHYLD